jgi:DNA repair protein RadC
MLLHDMHPVERPRHRLDRVGPEALSDAELVCVILGLKRVPDARALETFQSAPRLKAALEYARRKAGAADGRPVLDSPARVLELISPAVRAGKKEHLLAFYVNARSQLVHQETVSIGTLSASLVHPREVFSPAVAHCAAALIVAHNHPSGDCTPSPEDKDATRRLARAGELLGIPLLDHLVVSATGFFSFKERGLLM